MSVLNHRLGCFKFVVHLTLTYSTLDSDLTYTSMPKGPVGLRVETQWKTSSLRDRIQRDTRRVSPVNSAIIIIIISSSSSIAVAAAAAAVAVAASRVSLLTSLWRHTPRRHSPGGCWSSRKVEKYVGPVSSYRAAVHLELPSPSSITLTFDFLSSHSAHRLFMPWGKFTSSHQFQFFAVCFFFFSSLEPVRDRKSYGQHLWSDLLFLQFMNFAH